MDVAVLAHYSYVHGLGCRVPVYIGQGLLQDAKQRDLDVAREQLSIDLAQMQEGRLAMRLVEEARIVENQKWLAFYDALGVAQGASASRTSASWLPAPHPT